MKVDLLQDCHLKNLITFLSNFEEESRGKKFWEDRLNSWWNDNPSFNTNFNRGWVLVNASGKIVGFIGNIPINYIVNGKIKIVNNATTWRVLSEYRNYSILLLQEIIKSSNSTILFDTTPTVKVEKVLNLFKFSKLDVNKVTVIPISISEHTTNKYLNMIRTLIPLLNSFLSMFNKVFLSHPKHLQSKIISANEISTNFDDLWEKTEQNYSNTLLRNSKTIKWYFDNQHSFKKVIICCFKNKKMIGYGIFSIRGNVMSLIDFWSVSMKFEILKSIATDAFYYCKKNNINWLHFVHFNYHIKNMFEKLYPYKKSCDTKLYYKTKICDFESSDSFASLILGDLGL